jgi:putative copper export protein
MQGIKKVAIVLNGFIHDFATGYWLSALIAIYLLRRFQLESPALSVALTSIERFFFWNCVGAAVAIFATGGMRTFTYVDNFFGPEVERIRRKMLIVKHVVLLAVIGSGIYWGYRVSYL